MKTKDLILKLVRKNGSVKTSEVVKLADISRQTIAQHLRELINAKKIIKTGSTHNAKYIAYSQKRASAFNNISFFSSEYYLRNLNEDTVFNEASLRMNLRKKLSFNTYKIANYAFTEMLNNAIDHSMSSKCKVLLRCVNNKFEFLVTDKGIGVFESVRKKFKLKNHFEAVEHLLKGKQTTDPEHHSGQGIFFTSKIADLFILESAKLRLIIDNLKEDMILKDIKNIKGTKVQFVLNQRSRKELKKLFAEYSGDDYEFDKTNITVHLSEAGGEHISRSEAKRLLFGLDKFRRIVLDFKKVKGIGHSFADEIFRVFQSSHPQIKIEAKNISASVDFMIRKAVRAK